MLYGREFEQVAVSELLSGAAGRRSGVLAIKGEPGVGKSALLSYAAERAAQDNMRVLRATGNEYEAELPFAGLHLLLHRHLDQISALPPLQAAALRSAFGLQLDEPSGPGNRFMVGLAVLSLLAELAEPGPVVCVIDDAHWLDRASMDALAFAARRLGNEGVVLLFGVREPAPGFHAADLPELRLHGLTEAAADSLLAEHAADLSPCGRGRVVADTMGNPLALIELSAVQLQLERSADDPKQPGLPCETSLQLTDRVQAAFGTQVDRLPDPTRMLLLLTALEGAGSASVVLSAGVALGISVGDLDAARSSELVRLDQGMLVFRHPLVRAAVMNGAPVAARIAAHLALAGVRELPNDADRRAWHLAEAASGPDEAVADDLENAAQRARSRAGYSAEAAALFRAAELTADSGRRARRLAAAAEASMHAGALDWAAELARQAGSISTDKSLDARLALVYAAVEFERGSPQLAARHLMDAVRPIARSEPRLAAAMLAETVRNAFCGADTGLAATAVELLEAISPDVRSPMVAGMRGLALLLAGDPVTALPQLRPLIGIAIEGGGGLDPAERLIAGAMAILSGNDQSAKLVFDSLVEEIRASGMIGVLPLALLHLAMAEMRLGEIPSAVTHLEEGLDLALCTGQQMRAAQLRCVLAWPAAFAGDEQRCRDLIAPTLAQTVPDLNGSVGATLVLGLLDLVSARYDAILDRMDSAMAAAIGDHPMSFLLVPDQVEAAARLGQPHRVAAALARFEAWAAASEAPGARALALRCAALLAPDEAAGAHYADAIKLHQSAGRSFDLARTELLYGEWLRRALRRVDARIQLRSALQTFELLGADPWAARCRAELRATGEPDQTLRAAAPFGGLTPQELRVVRLAATGLSNRDIAARLFLSPRTVGYHLYKAYPKLGVSSRAELTRLDLSDPGS